MKTFKEWCESKNYVAYTGVVLYDLDRQRLIRYFNAEIPDGWKISADHMTINPGPATDGPAAELLGSQAELTVKAIAKDRKVVAIAVETNVPSLNQNKHITLAIGPEGKAQNSNDLKDWNPVPDLVVRGTIKEMEREGEAPKIRPQIPPKQPAPDNPIAFIQSLGTKPKNVIKMALRGKFPNLSDEEINSLVQ